MDTVVTSPKAYRPDLKTPAYAAASATSPVAPLAIARREPGPHDVLIDILYCGICHSDIHQVRNEWGGSIYPMVPGHEIIGKVAKIGSHVKKWKMGDVVGVGCFVDSDRTCEACKAGEEQYCESGMTPPITATSATARRRPMAATRPASPSTRITCSASRRAFRSSAPAPLLCAGITTYSPLKHFGLKPGDKLGVVGLGGLGHMAVKLGHAMGAHVTVLSHSPGKRDDALKLGADDFLVTRDESVFKEHAGRFDFILDTVSAEHDYNAYLNLLRRDGIMVLVGMPEPAAAQRILPRSRSGGAWRAR